MTPGRGLDFTGKRAVVTGGAHGIGRETARALRDGGAQVTVFDREPAADGPSRVVDVTDPDALAAAIDAVAPLDIVVANAGIGPNADLLATTRAQWENTLAVNLSGAFYTVQAAARVMRPRRQGAIVLTASTNAYDGEAGLVAYNASKAGLLGILHTAANELGPFGVRINAVCPGLIRTRMSQRQFDDPEYLRPYFQHIPLGRGGEPGEVAAAIAFLASDLAAYITGVALPVDGGQLAAKFGTWTDAAADFAVDRWRLRG
jgi:meso-butanediol dehydrogenase/(S,S)-butanediol dehydrogenase/diacetyl reductase